MMFFVDWREQMSWLYLSHPSIIRHYFCICLGGWFMLCVCASLLILLLFFAVVVWFLWPCYLNLILIYATPSKSLPWSWSWLPPFFSGWFVTTYAWRSICEDWWTRRCGSSCRWFRNKLRSSSTLYDGITALPIPGWHAPILEMRYACLLVTWKRYDNIWALMIFPLLDESYRLY